MGALGLFVVGFVAAALLWFGGVVLPRRLRSIDALRRFAADHDAHVQGDGGADALRIVGYVRGRMFTVLYQVDWLRGDVLMVGVDCATSAAGSHEQGGLQAEAGDSALASRWFGPPRALLMRMDTVVDALVQMAEELEATQPGGAEEE